MAFIREFARALTENFQLRHILLKFDTLFILGMQLQIYKLPQICFSSSVACLLF